ncbi:porin family protein [Tenacibaculum caenipelagi]|uniref:Outer membrane protein with beta-barrel domain n=1 Tax=Tenacibaculum caenipelagi TaxID=1325435 RepID=A0A4R6T932_9FLAO|nr:porin family protein [Tenacibaculum caenipelagi]TDQ21901.1 outer membrane protein with beta-barrel domain [Tenacibaculum caenipelagi]
MKHILTLFALLLSLSTFSQKDSLQIGDKYWEDQLYIDITYNLLNDQPDGVEKTGFSYGFSAGYIKDIPFNRKGKTALGVGLGYSFDSFNHNLKVLEGNVSEYEIDPEITSNKIKLHNIEMPIQFRWRSSNVNTYSFWRFYAGIKIVYNMNNNFQYNLPTESVKLSNVAKYNTWQTGLALSVGYGTFNFHVYYGLTPMFKNVKLNNNPIKSKIVRLGLSFYLL